MRKRFLALILAAAVGIGVGLLFLAREGLSFAMLRVMRVMTSVRRIAAEHRQLEKFHLD